MTKLYETDSCGCKYFERLCGCRYREQHGTGACTMVYICQVHREAHRREGMDDMEDIEA